MPSIRPFSRDNSATETLCEAAFALGRLAEAVRRSPLQIAWRLRETAHVAATLTTRRFGPARADELFALVAGAPMQRAFAGEEVLTAVAFWRHGLKRWFATPLPSPWTAGDSDEGDDEALLPSVPEDAELARTDVADPVTAAVAAMTEALSLPAILDRAVAYGKRDAGIGALELAFPLALQPVTSTVLPALALSTVRPRQGHSADVVRCARRIALEADAAHGRLRILEQAWRGWQARLPSVRTDSRLLDVISFLAYTPLLTAPRVASTLGLTRKAAVHHLNTLQSAGILREVTGRARWRLFCASNLPLTAWSHNGASLGPKHAKEGEAALSVPLEAANVTPPAPLDLGAVDRMLDYAYGAIDRATERVRSMLESGLARP